MGSPITTWENVEAYFTGFGGVSPMVILILAIGACVAALIMGHHHEADSYSKINTD